MGGLPIRYELRRKEGAIEFNVSAPGWSIRSILSLSPNEGDGAHVLVIEHGGATTVVDVRPRDLLDHEKAA
jgi:hypothetical protein